MDNTPNIGRVNRIYIWPRDAFKDPFGANLVATDRIRGNEVFILPKELVENEFKKNELIDFLIWDINLDNKTPAIDPITEIGICWGFKSPPIDSEDLNGNENDRKREIMYLCGSQDDIEEVERLGKLWLSFKNRSKHIDDIAPPTNDQYSIAEQLIKNIDDKFNLNE